MAGTDVEQAEDSPDSPDGKDDKPYDIYLGTMRGAFVSFGTGTKSTTKLVLGVQRQYRDVALKLQDEEGYIIEAHFYRRARRADRAAVRAGVGVRHVPHVWARYSQWRWRRLLRRLFLTLPVQGPSHLYIYVYPPTDGRRLTTSGNLKSFVDPAQNCRGSTAHRGHC